MVRRMMHRRGRGATARRRRPYRRDSSAPCAVARSTRPRGSYATALA